MPVQLLLLGILAADGTIQTSSSHIGLLRLRRRRLLLLLRCC